ncbi:hypothetical protein IE53DRAFT_378578 [Violaceomyces palustris]|uniref:Uncharacterized protein n=1 Tax=Violaceomyces palustris TaxID=1673888 RepID=A0ACD0P1D5_9BASI|nr:hypothetical protein IE53DRAFT_378578 [Violaceomyces palustris]
MVRADSGNEVPTDWTCWVEVPKLPQHLWTAYPQFRPRSPTMIATKAQPSPQPSSSARKRSNGGASSPSPRLGSSSSPQKTEPLGSKKPRIEIVDLEVEEEDEVRKDAPTKVEVAKPARDEVVEATPEAPGDQSNLLLDQELPRPRPKPVAATAKADTGKPKPVFLSPPSDEEDELEAEEQLAKEDGHGHGRKLNDGSQDEEQGFTIIETLSTPGASKRVTPASGVKAAEAKPSEVKGSLGKEGGQAAGRDVKEGREKSSKKKKKQREEEEEERRRRREKRKGKKQGKQRRPRSGSDEEEDDDLRSFLNADAFARSTGSNKKETYKKNLEKFQEERRKRLLNNASQSDGDDESLWGSRAGSSSSDGGSERGSESEKSSVIEEGDDSSSSSSGSSSGSADSLDFIVDDDFVDGDISYRPGGGGGEGKRSSTSGFKADSRRKGSKSRRGKEGKGGESMKPRSRTRSPAPHFSFLNQEPVGLTVSHGKHFLSQIGIGKQSMRELCLDWVEWAVCRCLIPWAKLSAADRVRLEKARSTLRGKMRGSEESLTSSVMRRQFKWYLCRLPKIEVRPLFRDETGAGSHASLGCAACHKRKQEATHSVIFSGNRYDEKTIGPLELSSDDSGSSEEVSTDAEGLAQDVRNSKGKMVKRFCVGSWCVKRAEVMHSLHHWEWSEIQNVRKATRVAEVMRRMQDGDEEEGASADEIVEIVEHFNRPGELVDRLKRSLDALVQKAVHFAGAA